MPIDGYRRGEDLDHDIARPRAVPRCYMRAAQSEAVLSRIDTESIALVLALGVISCVAAFLIVNGGWSF
jgi:hypothetical protein